mmetsp:Transcript_17937/g.15844  ORF Transcript_17937/g.15844 Transcript_17937/m.15844 type:complete len:166 (+) Transcript_17937:134-631(+)
MKLLKIGNKVWNIIDQTNQKNNLPETNIVKVPDFMTGSLNEVAFKSLISLIIMSMTREEYVVKSTHNLIIHGCTPENLLNTSHSDIVNMIKSVRFYNNKAKYIKQSARLLLDKFDGKVPDKFEQIKEFPGMGTVSSLMMCQFVFDNTQGVAVDSHIIRVGNELGW